LNHRGTEDTEKKNRNRVSERRRMSKNARTPAQKLPYSVEMELDPFGNAMAATCPPGRIDAQICWSLDATEEPYLKFDEVVIRADRAGLIRVAHELLALAHMAPGKEDDGSRHVHMADWDRLRKEKHAQVTVYLAKTEELPPDWWELRRAAKKKRRTTARKAKRARNARK
jgi:hypothetical protein